MREERAVEENVEDVEEPTFADVYMAAHDEWQRLTPGARELMHFDCFAQTRMDYYRSRQERRPRNQNKDLKQATNKLTLPMFDGSGKTTAQSWIHKLDTFLALRPMTEEEAIKFATLHLEGAAHDWWSHGMVTLQHNQVTSYQDFVDRLVEHFDKKRPGGFLP